MWYNQMVLDMRWWDVVGWIAARPSRYRDLISKMRVEKPIVIRAMKFWGYSGASDPRDFVEHDLRSKGVVLGGRVLQLCRRSS